jgi:hypothetical protein
LSSFVGSQHDIPLAIVLERLAVAVEGPAVELGDEVWRPERVDLVALDLGVDLRQRELGLVAELQEPVLELLS